MRAAVGGDPRPGARAQQGGGGAAVRAARGGVMMMCDSDVMRLELETNVCVPISHLLTVG